MEALIAGPADVSAVAHFISKIARKDLVLMALRLVAQDADTSLHRRRGPRGDEITRLARAAHVHPSTVKLWREGEIPSDRSVSHLLELLGGDNRSAQEVATLVALDAEGYSHHARAWYAHVTANLELRRNALLAQNRTGAPVLLAEARP